MKASYISMHNIMSLSCLTAKASLIGYLKPCQCDTSVIECTYQNLMQNNRIRIDAKLMELCSFKVVISMCVRECSQ